MRAFVPDESREDRGKHALAKATIDGEDYHAIGWNDRFTKTFTSTFGTTTPGEDAKVRRHDDEEKVSYVFYSRPKLLEWHCQASHIIDDHNRIDSLL